MLVPLLTALVPWLKKVQAWLKSTGTSISCLPINDIPLFTNRFIDFQTFKEKVFPIFAESLKRNLGERSAATAVDIFRPIKPRQYSIANRMDGSKHLKLIVKHLSYTKKATEGSPGSSVDWRSHNRQVRLAQKCKIFSQFASALCQSLSLPLSSLFVLFAPTLVLNI